MKVNDRSRNIPSLDGLRAISILLVIGGHSSEVFSRHIGISVAPFLFLAHTGVATFFVISGFLITSLLLQEQTASGTIRLKRFYIRRAFRIFPPFYFYLAIVFVLALTGVFHTPLRTFFFAAVYLLNYYLGPGAGFVGIQHIWSLCVEEQFYLLWPAALLLLGRRRAPYIATLLILVSPISRLITYAVLAPPHRAMVDRMFHSSIDTIMFGCLLAILWKEERFQRRVLPWIGSAAGAWAAAGSALFLLVLDPMLDQRFRGGYDLLVGMTIEGIAICIVLLRVVEKPRNLAGRFLNTRVLKHIGVISYSLYLWQNLITGSGARYFPANLLVLLACAEFSFWAIERPSLRLRDRLWKR